jgi:hypothetical protein
VTLTLAQPIPSDGLDFQRYTSLASLLVYARRFAQLPHLGSDGLVSELLAEFVRESRIRLSFLAQRRAPAREIRFLGGRP